MLPSLWTKDILHAGFQQLGLRQAVTIFLRIAAYSGVSLKRRRNSPLSEFFGVSQGVHRARQTTGGSLASWAFPGAAVSLFCGEVLVGHGSCTQGVARPPNQEEQPLPACASSGGEAAGAPLSAERGWLESRQALSASWPSRWYTMQENAKDFLHFQEELDTGCHGPNPD